MKKKLILIITLLLCLMYGCEGYRCADGIIRDSATNQPIDSVMCEAARGMGVEFSDSDGNYSICNRFGGCVPNCPDIEVTFSKVGYKTTTATNPKSGSVIYMEKD